MASNIRMHNLKHMFRNRLRHLAHNTMSFYKLARHAALCWPLGCWHFQARSLLCSKIDCGITRVAKMAMPYVSK